MSQTLQQIKDEYAREEGYEDWGDFLTSRSDNPFAVESAFNEIARHYAGACCKATQEKCAKNAKVVPAEGYMFRQQLDIRTILTPDNIVLL